MKRKRAASASRKRAKMPKVSQKEMDIMSRWKSTLQGSLEQWTDCVIHVEGSHLTFRGHKVVLAAAAA